MEKIPSRTETIENFKGNGGKIAAVLPIHYSRALLRAFNFLPVEIWGPPHIKTSKSAAHLQAYVCSICHNALSFIQQGGVDVADLILAPHACDSLQGLGSVLLDFASPRQPVFPLYLPRGTRQVDLDFLAAEFRSLYDRLSILTGRIPRDPDLLASIEREETADSFLKELHEQMRFLPFSNLEIYKLIRSREYLPAEEFTQIVQDALGMVQENPRHGTPILLEGILPEPMDILDILSDFDAVVAADDFACCGRRVYPVGTSPDPFIRMAERILGAPPDPMRGSPLQERCEYLMDRIKRSGARGVIFYIVKFCEPELFDIPILQEMLREADIPSIFIEMDLNSPPSHQVQTRLGAFLEMLQ